MVLSQRIKYGAEVTTTARLSLSHLVHLLLEGGEDLVASGERLLELFELLRVERELAPEVDLLPRQLLTALLLLQCLCQELNGRRIFSEEQRGPYYSRTRNSAMSLLFKDSQ